MLQHATAPPRITAQSAGEHLGSGAAGHKQRRKAENSHCAARRARHHHAGHIESTAGLAEMREQMRQAIKQQPTVSPCKQMPLSSQRDGANLASIFRTKKRGPKSVNPNSWGSHLWGLFGGPESGPHFRAAALSRWRMAAANRRLETRRALPTQMHCGIGVEIDKACHHIAIRAKA